MRSQKRHRIIFVLLIALALFVMPFILRRKADAERGGRKWAVVVGINEYMKEVTPLRCAVSDAENFKKALVEKAGFADGDVFLLTTKMKSGNRIPDRSNIVRWISYIKKNAGPNDTFIFFFSGHGMDMEKESYLLTYEADPYSKDTLEVSALKVSDLKKVILEMPTPRILLFIDACRNDPRSGKGDEDNKMTDSQSKNLVIKPGTSSQIGRADESFCLTFFSCNVGQRSYEWTEQGMGFFTYYLVKGLNGDAADERGNVTLASLRKYLADGVSTALQRERGKSMAQTPFVRGEKSPDADEWVFCNRVRAPKSGGKQLSVTMPVSQGGKTLLPNSFTPYQSAPNVDEACKHKDWGDDYILKKDFNNAINEYIEAIRWDPKDTDAKERLGGAYVKRGIAHYKKSDWDSALADLNKALEIDPKCALAYFNKGLVFENTQRYSEAVSAYKKFLEVAPSTEEEKIKIAREKIKQLSGKK